MKLARIGTFFPKEPLEIAGQRIASPLIGRAGSQVIAAQDDRGRTFAVIVALDRGALDATDLGSAVASHGDAGLRRLVQAVSASIRGSLPEDAAIAHARIAADLRAVVPPSITTPAWDAFVAWVDSGENAHEVTADDVGDHIKEQIVNAFLEAEQHDLDESISALNNAVDPDDEFKRAVDDGIASVKAAIDYRRVSNQMAETVAGIIKESGLTYVDEDDVYDENGEPTRSLDTLKKEANKLNNTLHALFDEVIEHTLRMVNESVEDALDDLQHEARAAGENADLPYGAWRNIAEALGWEGVGYGQKKPSSRRAKSAKKGKRR